MVGERSVSLRRWFVKTAGGIGSANADMSSDKGSNWSSATFTRGNYTESKLGKLPKARVTTKFDADGSPRKVEFTAVKFNNRWYYYGDMTWIDKIVE